MASLMVIKVKYGDTLRRFNANVNENDQLDLDMAGLKAKVLSLFSLNCDADITMTYMDEDGDVVTLVDDDDLSDVMRQQLKFLRISVQLNNAHAGRSYARSSGNSTPLRSPREAGPVPNLNRVAADVMQGLPEAFRAPLLKLSADVASKAASSNPIPIVSELIEAFSKIGLYPESPMGQKQTDNVEPSSKSKPVSRPIVDLNQLPVDGDSSEPSKVEPAVIFSGEDKKGKSVIVEKSEGSSAPTNNECPFSGVPVMPMFPVEPYLAKDMGGVFHRGIRCDGCGVHPITGPRFKSSVKDDYDLCSVCFAKMGTEAEYIRFDRPIALRHPRSFKGLHGHHPRVFPPHITGCARKCTRPKLDSRFILDVNINDGSLMSPGSSFTKIWRLRNNGGLVWPHKTQLVWIGGDKLSEALSVEVEIPENGVAVDGEIDVAVDFTAPMVPGRYVSYWRMSSPSGLKFGQRVWVLIQVDDIMKKPKPFPTSLPIPNLNLPVSSEITTIESERILSNKDFEFFQTPNLWLTDSMNEQDQSFLTNETLLMSPKASAPSATEAVSSVSYPIIDLTEKPADDLLHKSTPVTVTSSLVGFASSSSAPPVLFDAGASEEGKDVKLPQEKALLRELEEMGFRQIDLNTKVLRKNEYDLGRSVDELCDVAEWDPILEDLIEMGFCDTEMNKKLLEKNKGSIKHVVMDLVNGEKS